MIKDLAPPQAPPLQVVGWYSTGEEVNDSSLLFHEFYGQGVERPIHLLLDLGFGDRCMSCKVHCGMSNTLQNSPRLISAFAGVHFQATDPWPATARDAFSGAIWLNTRTLTGTHPTTTLTPPALPVRQDVKLAVPNAKADRVGLDTLFKNLGAYSRARTLPHARITHSSRHDRGTGTSVGIGGTSEVWRPQRTTLSRGTQLVLHLALPFRRAPRA